jgi:hypothetical protein
MPKAATTAFEVVTPILRVRSLAASIDYYPRLQEGEPRSVGRCEAVKRSE